MISKKRDIEMKLNPLAAMMARRQMTRYESPTRGEDYYEAMLHLQLAAWMAALYDEEPDSAVRRCCKRLEMRFRDYKVKGIIIGIRNSETPTDLLLMLVSDMEKTLSGQEISKEEEEAMKSRF